jgi:hypothetical protein
MEEAKGLFQFLVMPRCRHAPLGISSQDFGRLTTGGFFFFPIDAVLRPMNELLLADPKSSVDSE